MVYVSAGSAGFESTQRADLSAYKENDQWMKWTNEEMRHAPLGVKDFTIVLSLFVFLRFLFPLT